MQKLIAEIASEYWKLLRSLERAITLVPLEAQARLNSQRRYSEDRLDVLLAGQGMRLITFDGVAYEVNLPASAINAEDFKDTDIVVVERTLEPAVVSDMDVVLSGKVFLADPSNR